MANSEGFVYIAGDTLAMRKADKGRNKEFLLLPRDFLIISNP